MSFKVNKVSSVYIPRKKQISFKKLFEELQKKGIYPVKDRWRESGKTKVYVGWGNAVVGDNRVVLGTNGIFGCAALKVADPTADNLSYLSHIFHAGNNSVKDIEQSLRKAVGLGMNLYDSKIEIMPGDLLAYEAPSRILNALYIINPSLIDNVRLIRDFILGRYDDSQGIIVQEGKNYRYPNFMLIDHKCEPIPSFHAVSHKYEFVPCSHTLSKDGYENVLSPVHW